ncbi:MAG: phosphoribosylglycinamide formyltransferase [Myxococcota bacterium]|nr:phosphoribosylglycinamide formyltransferase [Myxococcota bacterium]
MSVGVGVLVSGSGTNLQALIDAAQTPGYPAHIAVVISSRRDVQALERARAADIPAVWMSPRQHDSRKAYEHALTAELQSHGVEWVALAGFMRLLGRDFLEAWPERVLNIHPALLPAFPGLDAQRQAVEHGVRISGATVHLVDEGTDTGPILMQGAVPVLADDDRDSLQQRILAMEHKIYPKALRWAVEGRLKRRGRTIEIDLPEGEQAWIMEPA